MMRSLRHVGILLAVVMLVMGIGVQPSIAGSSTAIRVQERVLSDYSGQELSGAEFFNEDLEGTDPDGTYVLDWEYVPGLGALDECNGITIDGNYMYLITNDYPYIGRCLKGVL